MEIVSRPTPERLARASAELNILRHNHKQVVSAQQLHERERKKYVPDMSGTISAIVNMFKESFGTTLSALKKKTGFSKLAQARITEDDIGWKRMLKHRGRLKAWVENVILPKELWAVTPSFEQQDDDDDSRLDDVPDAELVFDSGSDSDSDAESDDDERLSVVRDKHQKSMQKFWMPSMKPLPK